MGNVLLDEYRKGDPAQNFQKWLETNPDLIDKTTITENKFFRTCSFTHRTRRIIMKVFFTRELSIVKEHFKGFEIMQQKVQSINCCHILPLRLIDMKDTAKAGGNFVGACRQYTQTTLQNRLLGRPRLTIQNKRWIIFQMILTVYTVHKDFNLYHGNIRTSNFLLTNYELIILTDFAHYKPIYINEEMESGLAEFRLFYGSSINKCALAPQKMAGSKNIPESERNPASLLRNYTPVTLEKQITQETSRYSVTPMKNSFGNASNLGSMNLGAVQYNQTIKNLKMMDMFSLGCSILEVINDGKPVFSYQTLLSWKKNEFQIKGFIEKSTEQLPDGDKIKIIILQLLKQRPTSRAEIGQVLQQWLKIVNQDVYLLLWHVISAFSTTSFHLPDFRICLFRQIFQFIESEVKKTNYIFKMARPNSLKKFDALKIFVGILKNKIIPILQPGQNHILKMIMSHIESSQVIEKQVQSQNEQVLVQDLSQRHDFFISNVRGKPKRSSHMNPSNISYPNICPPQWNQSLMSLIEPKYKGTKLTFEQELKNRFQDNLQKIKKNQPYRQERLKQERTYYREFQLAFKIIYSCLRGCKYVNSKLAGIQLLTLLGSQSTDSCRLRTLIPYLISLSQDADISVARYCLHSFIDTCYRIIDPFVNEDDTQYYNLIVQTLVTNIKNTRLRSSIFWRLRQIFDICQWLELHCKRIVKNYKKTSFRAIVQAIKQGYGTFSPIQIQLLMTNLPHSLVPEFFEYFISFLNTERLLGLHESIIIAQKVDFELHKKMFGIIDSCVQNSLEENGIALRYAIKYFTIRKITNKQIVHKIAPLIIHPHIWVNQQAMAYIHMCLKECPPTRIFLVFRQIFQPPFPLQPKDIGDQILLPKMLYDSQVDYKKSKIIESPQRRLGLTERLFEEQYLKRIKAIRAYPVTTQQQLTEWVNKSKPVRDVAVTANVSRLIQPTDFSVEIRNAVIELYETNFLFYIGVMEKKYRFSDKEKQKQKNLAELQDACRRFNKFVLQDRTITYEKKIFFENFLTIINTNFEKLLKKMNREYSSQKLKISNGIYLISSILQKFEQFDVRPQLKLGSYFHKPTQFQKLPRPKGIQISQIYEHKDMITCIEKIANTFFISGSNDGTLRVFNSKNIDMNVIASSEAFYDVKTQNSESAKVSSIAVFDGTYSVAVGTSKGQIRIYQVQRMPGRQMPSSSNKNPKGAQLNKYTVGGQIQKVSTFNNERNNQCFCYMTAQGNLGIQDMRMKGKTVVSTLGRERGIPRAMTVSKTDQSILIGTIDGYLLNYDIRCNIISSVLQLHNDNVPTGILNIQPAPLRETQIEQCYVVTYPSKHYEFCYFNFLNDRQEFHAQRQYTSATPNDIATVPYFVNKTNEENFKLCNNTLTHKIYYSTLSDFTRNFSILDYLSDPLTIRENKIREVWMDECKHRYNQICSLYNKKSLPFLQYLNSGILTNLNPCISNQLNQFNQKGTSSYPLANSKKPPLTLLVEPPKKEAMRQSYRQSIRQNPDSIERVLTQRQNNFKTQAFPDQESSEYFTCCRVLPNYVVVGCRNSVIKIYK